MAQPQSDEFKVAAKRSKDMESLPEDHELLSVSTKSAILPDI